MTRHSEPNQATRVATCLNADPETGFVARQLSGIAALISQANGFVNLALYRLKKQHAASIVDITAGDNWFYAGVPRYAPGAGWACSTSPRSSTSAAEK